jgi:hypothetical protein
MQAVIDVHGTHAAGLEQRAQRGDGVNEDAGIQPAAQGDEEASRRRAGEQRRRNRGGFEWRAHVRRLPAGGESIAKRACAPRSAVYSR